MPNPGSHPATCRVTLFVYRRLNSARDRGSGMGPFSSCGIAVIRVAATWRRRASRRRHRRARAAQRAAASTATDHKPIAESGRLTSVATPIPSVVATHTGAPATIPATVPSTRADGDDAEALPYDASPQAARRQPEARQRGQLASAPVAGGDEHVEQHGRAEHGRDGGERSRERPQPGQVGDVAGRDG